MSKTTMGESKMKTIDSFNDDYDFLSNFYLVCVEYEGLIYPSTEHAYQAAKSLNPKARKTIRDAKNSAGVPDCGRAKKMGQKLTLRKDWEYVKRTVMLDLLRKKFAQDGHGHKKHNLKSKLISTGNAKLVEGNWWKDTYWGVCNGKGQNWLGRLLMTVREELLEQKKRSVVLDKDNNYLSREAVLGKIKEE
ncbi:hypothetical protein LCGC14_0478660 [marine sediment metagenome]|uniref:NADAR domain-containing protein n=1 Tax=marine sediment metagenome TaxID=412755 RepID=A0A0F9ST02_9ZZZZ